MQTLSPMDLTAILHITVKLDDKSGTYIPAQLSVHLRHDKDIRLAMA